MGGGCRGALRRRLTPWSPSWSSVGWQGGHFEADSGQAAAPAALLHLCPAKAKAALPCPPCRNKPAGARGHVKRVRCESSAAMVPKDKAVKRFVVSWGAGSGAAGWWAWGLGLSALSSHGALAPPLASKTHPLQGKAMHRSQPTAHAPTSLTLAARPRLPLKLPPPGSHQLQVRNMVDASALRDIQEASALEGYMLPKMYR